ncbi:hypothetical protein I545_2051 [Mycobacterium kansasii 662]|uniref:Uncharacterized protein n=2 Tax=Mycobacterium kansasii TaxID=1768 RepID=A0A1V3XGG8_MYCKA|nr:hypothetical protein I545_2051 [Mycobacterium kansasii 662]KEP40019.1 hypothetical protein MKSMC1_48300 [Mycobacterium kansasii]OOK78289.1 hypothetical protein BZL30_2235 [Mycobacterium kansasii]OOK80051.1 hypothetical protein BZL29_2230 [Mycobacterium kansasii]
MKRSWDGFGQSWCRLFGGRKLGKVGVRAFADVLSAEQSIISITIANPNPVSNTEVGRCGCGSYRKPSRGSRQT